MKNQVITLIAAILVLGSVYSGSAQVRLGAKAGVNLANQNYDDFGVDLDLKILPSLMVGAVVEFDFSENLGLGTGIQYHGKGAKYEESGDEQKTTINYLQVPVQLQFRSGGFFGAVGPYVAFAFGGQFDDNGDKEDLEFGSGVDDDFSALDFGINIEAGYEFGQLRATALYGLGLANGIPADQQDLLGDASITNTVIGVALTYLFGGTE